MTTYNEMAQRAKPEAAIALASVLLRIYEADRTQNCGAVNGEASLCAAFREQARHALEDAGVLYKPEPEPQFPEHLDDDLYWNAQREQFQCGHCGRQYDRSTYFEHWKSSERCQRAAIEYEIRSTFPYLDLRHYKSKAAAAKALHKKLIELGFDSAFIYSPQQQRERGEHPLWTVGVEGGPYEWAITWTGTGATNGAFGYCECEYSFSVYFVD